MLKNNENEMIEQARLKLLMMLMHKDIPGLEMKIRTSHNKNKNQIYCWIMCNYSGHEFWITFFEKWYDAEFYMNHINTDNIMFTHVKPGAGKITSRQLFSKKNKSDDLEWANPLEYLENKDGMYYITSKDILESDKLAEDVIGAFALFILTHTDEFFIDWMRSLKINKETE